MKNILKSYVLNTFLEDVAVSGRKVDIIIKNGAHVYGRIIDFDASSLLVDVGEAEDLVMLDAVSTICHRQRKEGHDVE